MAAVARGAAPVRPQTVLVIHASVCRDAYEYAVDMTGPSSRSRWPHKSLVEGTKYITRTLQDGRIGVASVDVTDVKPQRPRNDHIKPLTLPRDAKRRTGLDGAVSMFGELTPAKTSRLRRKASRQKWRAWPHAAIVWVYNLGRPPEGGDHLLLSAIQLVLQVFHGFLLIPSS